MAKKAKQFTVTDRKLVLTLGVVEEGGYIVTSPFNPDVLTQADSLEKAFENARDVIALYAEERKATANKKIKATSK